jgi:thiamine-monophosphate kinase
MKLRDIGEFGFIDRIRNGCLIRPRGVVQAIGDDAAAFRPPVDRLMLLTTDLLLEGVHFVAEATSGSNLGTKALAVNFSDIAAMGGDALDTFVSIAAPGDAPLDFLDDLYRGMKALATEFDVNILGGDTTGSLRDVVISVAVTGSVPEDEILLRSAARPGDILFSTGFLGDSRAGLHLILNRVPLEPTWLSNLFNAHVTPRPHLHEGRFLAAGKKVHAAIDVSDGLSSDIGHIVRESHVGALLHASRIPVSPNLQMFCARFGFDPVEFALIGGEDYSLLVTVPEVHADAVAEGYLNRFQRPLYPLGEITDSDKIELIADNGRLREVPPTGWDHFRSGKNK